MSGKFDQALRDISRGAGVVYAGLILEVIIAFLAQVLAARYLSLAEFGGITIGTAILEIAAILTTLGYGPGLTRYLPRLDEADKLAISRLVLLIIVPLSVIAGLIVSLNAEFVARVVLGDSSVTASVRIFGAAIPFSALFTVLIGGIRGQKRPSYRVLVQNIVRPVLRFGLVVLAVVLGFDQAGFATAYAVPYVVGALIALVLFARSLPGLLGWPTMNRRLLAEVTSYSLPFTVSGAASFLYRSADIFLVIYFLDSQAVAQYGVAYAAARLVLMFSTAFNFLGAPVTSELEADASSPEILSIQQPIIRWLVILSIPALVPLVFFPGEFIAIVYRPRYASAGAALAILAIGFAVHNALSTQSSVLQALGQSRVLAFNSSVAAVINIVLNLALIPVYGVTGAALATFVSYLLMDSLMLVEVRYYTGHRPISRSVFDTILVAVPFLAVLTFVAPRIPGTLLWIVGVSAAFGVSYLAAIVVVLGLLPEEVMLVRSAKERYGLDYWPVNALLRRYQ